MKFYSFASSLVGLLATRSAGQLIIERHPLATPFEVDLSKGVPRMLDLIERNVLPANEEYYGVGSSFGISLDTMKGFKKEWTSSFNWTREEVAINQYKQYTVIIEGLTIHFLYEKSGDPHAIPLIMNHGWPGSFLEFLPTIDDLTRTATLLNGKTISFDVIVPSLPGFAFSTAPPANWTIDDTARIFNTLMTQVLGYENYAVHGTDWGSGVSYSMYDQFNQSVRALSLSFLPFTPLTTKQLIAENISLTPEEEYEEGGSIAWSQTGNAYFTEMTTKPNTIGLALYDSPVGQLAWIGEKYIVWSDPRAGTGPSVLTHNEILREVSLYYLTKSFVSAAYTYAQNPNGFKPNYTKAANDAPLLFSSFKYNVGFWPPQKVAEVGNLVQYTYHDFGGHFSGLDNPPALVEDVRQIGLYWTAQQRDSN